MLGQHGTPMGLSVRSGNEEGGFTGRVRSRRVKITRAASATMWPFKIFERGSNLCRRGKAHQGYCTDLIVKLEDALMLQTEIAAHSGGSRYFS